MPADSLYSQKITLELKLKFVSIFAKCIFGFLQSQKLANIVSFANFYLVNPSVLSDTEPYGGTTSRAPSKGDPYNV